jgi:hypothetical protein
LVRSKVELGPIRRGRRRRLPNRPKVSEVVRRSQNRHFDVRNVLQEIFRREVTF